MKRSALCQLNIQLSLLPVQVVQERQPSAMAFRKIFQQLNIRAAELEGDSFHYYTRPEMDHKIRESYEKGRPILVILVPKRIILVC